MNDGPRQPIDVGLADIYRLDFGRRDDDWPTWDALALAAGDGPVLDVGCGDGRATKMLRWRGREVWGIDRDARLLAAARDAGVRAVGAVAGADDPAAYLGLPPAALALCAYSTLWLLPHDQHERVLARMAEAVRPGGLVAVEVFIPRYHEDHEVEQACADPSDPSRPPWVRLSRFTVHEEIRTTAIERLYGPERGRWTMRLSERVCWRDPAELALLARRSGLAEVIVSDGRRRATPVAPGHALLVGRR